jgi:hypothetical protein
MHALRAGLAFETGRWGGSRARARDELSGCRRGSGANARARTCRAAKGGVLAPSGCSLDARARHGWHVRADRNGGCWMGLCSCGFRRSKACSWRAGRYTVGSSDSPHCSPYRRALRVRPAATRRRLPRQPGPQALRFPPTAQPSTPSLVPPGVPSPLPSAARPASPHLQPGRMHRGVSAPAPAPPAGRRPSALRPRPRRPASGGRSGRG